MSAQGPMLRPDPARVTDALLTAIQRAAEDAAAAADPRETKELAQAAQAFAQAVVVLDPTRLAGGDTPEARRASVPPPAPTGRDGDHDGQVGEQ